MVPKAIRQRAQTLTNEAHVGGTFETDPGIVECFANNPARGNLERCKSSLQFLG